MSDFPISKAEDADAGHPDAEPAAGNHRSPMFASVLKSLVNPERGSTAKNGVAEVNGAGGGDAINGTSNGQGSTSHPPPHTPLDTQIEIEDWDSLFDAVEERLRDTVDKLDSATTPWVAQDAAGRLKSVVLDCVSDLDKLHRALAQERSMHVPARANATTSEVSVAPPLTNGHDTRPNN